MKQAITIKPYDSNLPFYFKKERNFLIKNLGGEFGIHHIGSSAVRGLGGKNVLDILLIAPNKKKANAIVKRLEFMGYVQNKSGGDKDRIFFNRSAFYKKKIHVHLHIMWKTVKKYRDALAFRYYLRRHPEEAKKYYILKKIWAKKAGRIGRKYRNSKTDYIRNVLKKAKLENIY